MNSEHTRRLQEFLFASEEEMQEAKLAAPVRARILRLRDLYLYWLNSPRLRDKQIVLEAKRRYGIADRMAYDDVRVVKMCLGTLNKATTDYYRWVFLERCEEAFKMARDSGDAGAFAKVLATYGKYTGLDKDESRLPDYSTITPQAFEITADVANAGFTPIPNLDEKIARLEAKYIKAIAEDAEPIEVKPLKPEFHTPEKSETW